MKQKLTALFLCLTMIALCAVAGAETYSKTVPGYNGDMQVEIDIQDKKIKDIRIVSDNESSPVKKRAFPLIIDRILEAQSPEIDSVTGATFSSYSIKSAVAEAMKEAGMEVDKISFNNPEPEGRIEKEAVKKPLLIIGAGPAGLTAAISAVEAGMDAKDVLVIEKLDITGGNGKFDMVLFNHVNSEAQKKAGIEDSVEKFIAARKKGGAWDSDARLQVEAEMTTTMDEWYRSMGIELNYVYDTRSHMAEKDEYAGEELLDGIEARAKDLGIEIRTGTKALELIMDDGKLIGASVCHNNEYYDILSDAVVIATGGFCQSPELLKKYTPEGTSLLRSSNQISNTGDMVPQFEKNGFQLGHMDKTVVFGSMISHGRELTGERVAPQAYDYILVNRQGERFTNEMVSYGLDRGMDIYNQEGHSCYMLFDQGMVDFSFRVGRHIKEGLGVEAATWEELAEKIGVDKDNMLKSVENYNKAAEEKIEDELRGEVPSRPFNAEGPYYALNIETAIHMTKGGVVCDENARCLNNDGDVIPGAFAAGEVTDTSANFSAAFVFGRIAGQQAAAYIAGK